jgi:Ca-activated chloride channel family protein
MNACHRNLSEQMARIVGLVLLAALAAGPMSADAKSVACRVELDRAVLPEEGARKAVVKVTLEAAPVASAVQRPPVNLVIVLDKSGSMAGDKLEKAKEAAVEALRRLTARDLFSLVVYDSGVETLVPAQSAANTEWIESRIRQIRAGSNTALFGGVSQGASEIRKHLDGGYVHRILLLSDGLANVGPSSPDDLGRLGAALVKEGISVTTVGVGTDYNEDLMTRLAQSSDGNTYFVQESRDLPRIFAAELGDVLSVAAKKVILTIECPDGVRPVGVIGREGRIRGQTIELSLNQLYGGQEKFALVELDIPAGKPGDRRPVATARVSYEDAATRETATATAMATVTFSADTREVEKSVNAPVQKAVAVNLKAEAQGRAVTLADEGRRNEAAEELKQSAGYLRETGKKLNDAQLLKEAESLEERARDVERRGLDKSGRKGLMTDSFQTINQQMAQ